MRSRTSNRVAWVLGSMLRVPETRYRVWQTKMCHIATRDFRCGGEVSGSHGNYTQLPMGKPFPQPFSRQSTWYVGQVFVSIQPMADSSDNAIVDHDLDARHEQLLFQTLKWERCDDPETRPCRFSLPMRVESLWNAERVHALDTVQNLQKSLKNLQRTTTFCT